MAGGKKTPFSGTCLKTENRLPTRNFENWIHEEIHRKKIRGTLFGHLERPMPSKVSQARNTALRYFKPPLLPPQDIKVYFYLGRGFMIFFSTFFVKIVLSGSLWGVWTRYTREPSGSSPVTPIFGDFFRWPLKKIVGHELFFLVENGRFFFLVFYISYIFF